MGSRKTAGSNCSGLIVTESTLRNGVGEVQRRLAPQACSARQKLVRRFLVVNRSDRAGDAAGSELLAIIERFRFGLGSAVRLP